MNRPACSFLLLPRLRGRPGGGSLGVTGGCRASPAASAGGNGPSPCPLPAGEGLPGRAVPSSPSWGSGRLLPSAGATMGGKCPPAASRAIRCANRACARRARAGAGAQAGYARKKGPAAWGRPGRRRRGRAGAERNATEERYAGTEPQTFGGGMGNMTLHDTSSVAPPKAARTARIGKDGRPAGQGRPTKPFAPLAGGTRRRRPQDAS